VARRRAHWIQPLCKRNLVVNQYVYRQLVSLALKLCACRVWTTDGPQKSFDFQETYLGAVLGFLGLTDISFIRAEGVSMGPEAARNAMQSAENQLMEALGSMA